MLSTRTRYPFSSMPAGIKPGPLHRTNQRRGDEMIALQSSAQNIRSTLGIKAAIGYMKKRGINFDTAYVWMFGHTAYAKMSKGSWK